MDSPGMAHFGQAHDIFEKLIAYLQQALATGVDPISCWATGVLAFQEQWGREGLNRRVVASIIMLAALKRAQDRATQQVDVTRIGKLTVAEIDQMHASSSEGLDTLIESARRGRAMEPGDVALWHALASTGAEAHPGEVSIYGLANLQMLCEAVVRLSKLEAAAGETHE